MNASKIILLLAALLVISSSFAQNSEEQEFNEEIFPDTSVIDSLPKKIIFGFSLGKSQNRFYEDQSLGSIAAFGRGFYLGLISERIFSKHFSVVLQSNLLISDTKKWVKDDDQILYETSLSPVTLTIAPLAMVRLPLKKFNPYLSAGPTMRLPIKSEVPGERIYGVKPDVAISACVGFEKKLGDIILCPEVSYLYGLRDINKSPFIGSLIAHSLLFGITIKG
jgi:hypothetical protein